jgi:hypothetical protein
MVASFTSCNTALRGLVDPAFERLTLDAAPILPRMVDTMVCGATAGVCRDGAGGIYRRCAALKVTLAACELPFTE